ncbi:nucleoside hydrolase [Corynebacterium sanguinis]|uniref:nucleoside hydrolase n=1 Tax=Corynebacterium sanguinis TaxID=2594913 RepID=UPI00223ADB69|nr:nucleoside hydrolase [Corynebacterium sanguinis]MCT1627803.1 nucleoside hydrolase [Corynebacterium sanguinis]
MKRVVLDCDPGIDDTCALIYLAALHHEGSVELEAVTTTSGNVEATQCAVNAAWVLAQCGLRTISLAAGMANPLVLPLTTTPETHGETGLGYVSAPARHVENDWDMLWCDAIERGTDDLHLVVTGPLTNLAAFRRLHPSHFAQLKHITVMGGALDYPGNTTETAEWNFWVDPHAVRDVFAHTPVPITLCSLGVTERMVLTPETLATAIDALGPAPIARDLGEILRFYFEFHELENLGYVAQVHDLLTAMVALGTVLFDAPSTTISVHSDDDDQRGTSTIVTGKANACVVARADVDAAHREFVRACGVHARFFGGSADLDATRHARAED